MRSILEVFAAFLKLGLTSFGGPVAHLGYFHRELIERRRWIDEARYAQLIALCQFLPGPASSQLGFALGLIRAGWGGALAAFVAFTLPSALLLFAFAYFMPMLEQPYGQAAIHGLKLLAVAVVAQGVVVMARRLTPDVPRILIALMAGSIAMAGGSAAVQLLIVAMGALLGLAFCRGVPPISGASIDLRYGVRTGIALLGIFAVLLAVALASNSINYPLASVAAAFYRAGALVFGGGHVVLPLLQEAVVAPGWVSPGDFLAGYGAAQAVPGPMFSIASFLGARLEGMGGGGLGAAVSVVAVFLPGLLLVAAVLPLWSGLANRKGAASAFTGINAAVVGLLAAALYSPVWTGAVFSFMDAAVALIGFALLALMRASVLIVLAWCVLTAVVRV